MTVAVTPVSISFVGDGVATDFGDINFPVLDTVAVYVDGALVVATLSTDKKTVQLPSAPIAGADITVVRTTNEEQTVSFIDIKTLPGDKIEGQLDRLVYIAQDHGALFERALIAPPGVDVNGQIMIGVSSDTFALVWPVDFPVGVISDNVGDGTASSAASSKRVNALEQGSVTSVTLLSDLSAYTGINQNIYVDHVVAGDALGGLFAKTSDIGEMPQLDPDGYNHIALAGTSGYVRAAPLADNPYLIYDNSPTLDWAGSVWHVVGTSIEHQGANVDDFYTQAGEELGAASVLNMGWSGSQVATPALEAGEDPLAPNNLNFVKSLARSNRAIQYHIDNAPPGSYWEGDGVTLPLQMGYEYRIGDQFDAAASAVTHFFFGHQHNDRLTALGNVAAVEVNITAVTKGTQTTLTLAAGHGIVDFANIVVSLAAIPLLDGWAGENVSLVGNDIVIALDTSAVSETLSGVAKIKIYDISTYYGAAQFVLGYADWKANALGWPPLIKILVAAPSRYTGGVKDANIERINQAMRVLSKNLQVAHMPMDRFLDIESADENVLILSDNVHPLSAAARRVFAGEVVQWARFNGAKVVAANQQLKYVKNAELPSPATGTFLLYDAANKVFTEPDQLFGLAVQYTGPNTGDFTLGTLVTLETPPTTALGATAIKIAPGGADATNAIALAAPHTVAEFDFMIVDNAPFVSSGTLGSQTLVVMTAPDFALQMITSATGVLNRFRMRATDVGGAALGVIVDYTFTPASNQVYKIRIERRVATPRLSGGLLLYIDDVYRAIIVNDQIAPWTEFTLEGNFNGTTLSDVWCGNVTVKSTDLRISLGADDVIAAVDALPTVLADGGLWDGVVAGDVTAHLVYRGAGTGSMTDVPAVVTYGVFKNEPRGAFQKQTFVERDATNHTLRSWERHKPFGGSYVAWIAT